MKLCTVQEFEELGAARRLLHVGCFALSGVFGGLPCSMSSQIVCSVVVPQYLDQSIGTLTRVYEETHCKGRERQCVIYEKQYHYNQIDPKEAGWVASRRKLTVNAASTYRNPDMRISGCGCARFQMDKAASRQRNHALGLGTRTPFHRFIGCRLMSLPDKLKYGMFRA